MQADILGELKRLLQLRQEASKRYRAQKSKILDYDIRAYYDILTTARELDEGRLTSLINQLEQQSPN
jgi:hypothetical protein